MKYWASLTKHSDGNIGLYGSSMVGSGASVNTPIFALHVRNGELVVMNVHSSLARREEILPSVLLPRDFRFRVTRCCAVERRTLASLHGDVSGEFRKSWND